MSKIYMLLSSNKTELSWFKAIENDEKINGIGTEMLHTNAIFNKKIQKGELQGRKKLTNSYWLTWKWSNYKKECTLSYYYFYGMVKAPKALSTLRLINRNQGSGEIIIIVLTSSICYLHQISRNNTFFQYPTMLLFCIFTSKRFICEQILWIHKVYIYFSFD